MQIGYALVLDADPKAVQAQQRRMLAAAGVDAEHLYEDSTSSRQGERPGLQACLSALQAGDTLVIWHLDRLVTSRAQLIDVLQELWRRNIGLKVLAGKGDILDSAHINLKVVIDLIEAISELESAIIGERTAEALAVARARGQSLGAQRKMTVAMLRKARAALADSNASATQIAENLGITRATLYNYLNGDGSLKPAGERLLAEEE